MTAPTTRVCPVCMEFHDGDGTGPCAACAGDPFLVWCPDCHTFHQCRERAVPCALCGKPTFNPHPFCDGPLCKLGRSRLRLVA